MNNKYESIHKYFKVHDENVNNNFNDAKVWILGNQHHNENHTSKITWLIDNFCNEEDIILIESSYDDYHLIERINSSGTKYLNVDGWDDVFPEIYHNYKNLFIEIIMHINHVRMNSHDENCINNIYKLMNFFSEFDKLHIKGNCLPEIEPDDRSIDYSMSNDLISGDSLSYELKNLLKKSNTDQIVFFNSIITKLYEYMLFELNQNRINGLIERNQSMVLIINKYLDAGIYKKIIVITGIAHISDEYTFYINEQIKNANLVVKSANLVIKNYIKNIPHIILVPNEANIIYTMKPFKSRMRNLENRIYTDRKTNYKNNIIVDHNQCYYFMGCCSIIILMLFYSNNWNPLYVIVSILFILLFYYYFLCEIHIESYSEKSNELIDRLNSLTCFQLLDLIKELSNNVNILPQKNLILQSDCD